MTEDNPIVGPDGKPVPVEETPPAEPPEPKCLSEGFRACGCYVRKMDDGTNQVKFCPPHALQQAGLALRNAGGALDMAAQRLIEDQEAMAAQEELKKGKRAVDKGIRRILRGKGRRRP